MNILLLYLAIAVAMVTPAHVDAQDAADDDAARRLFHVGKASFDAGDFEQALKHFEQAFETSHRPQLQYNVGLAADRLRQDDKALAAFNAYLEQVPDAENRAEVEGRIRALERAKAERETSAVPSPNQVALRASSGPGGADLVAANGEQKADSGTGRPITTKWWFWTAIGVAVVTGVIVGIAVGTGGDPDTAEPFDSRSGLSVMALTGRR